MNYLFQIRFLAKNQQNKICLWTIRVKIWPAVEPNGHLPEIRWVWFIISMAPLWIIARPCSTVDIFRKVAPISLFIPQQSLSLCSSARRMVEASKSAVEKAEAVVLIGQKLLVKWRVLGASHILLWRWQTINARAMAF